MQKEDEERWGCDTFSASFFKFQEVWVLVPSPPPRVSHFFLFILMTCPWCDVCYLFIIFASLLLCPPAMLQRWWRQQAGSPWLRLILTWWPKLTAPWLQPSALFLDPHASASNNPNSLTGGHVHSYIHTHMHTDTKKHTRPSLKYTGLTFPLAVTYYTTYILPQIAPFCPI